MQPSAATFSSQPDPAPAQPSSFSATIRLPSQEQLSQPFVPSITSPPLPAAPAHPTIPLPDIDLDRQPYTQSSTSFLFDPDPHGASLEDTIAAGQTQLHANPNATSNANVTMDAHGRTPNVYINGLPPHFPEDQLLAMAAPFGEVRSVRTFTRHVRDSESGYGFVLFASVEAAEKCITSLRRYRNLHPTFSKQVHKIPGTQYSQLDLHPEHTPPGSASSLAGWEQESLEDDGSFKAKMESLHDPTSTNLYMEGLPLSIDEPTLAALVSPHRISSSRFFQTRLSNPPRIIAFVRFETRAGAEEIIERLHGRMVRGWNDTGSRISVRFADTAEQRELRRAERTAKDGDRSPARITIAQAALLNLHGQDQLLRSASISNSHSHPISLSPGPHLHPRHQPSLPALNLNPNLTRTLDPQYPYTHQSEYTPMVMSHAHPYVPSPPPFAVDYSLAPGRAPVPSPYALSRTQTPSPYHPHALPDARVAQSMDPSMSALLDTLRANGSPFHPGHGGGNTYPGPLAARAQGYHTHQDMSHHLAANRAADVNYNLATYGGAAGVVAQAQSGYTATEEYIMRAHAEASGNVNGNASVLRRRVPPPPLDLARRRREGEVNVNKNAGIGVGMRGYRAQASAMAVARQQQQQPQQGLNAFSPNSIMEPLPLMSEEEFHASAEATHHQPQMSDGNRNMNAHSMNANMNTNNSTTLHKHNHRIHPAHVNARLSRDHQHQQHQNTNSPSLVQALTQTQTQMQAPSPNPNLNPAPIHYNYQNQHGVHMRSSTLPQHRSTSSVSAAANASRHYQHNSMSIPSSNSSLNSISQNVNLGRPTGNNNLMNKNITIANDAISIYDASNRQTDGINVNSISNNGNGIHYDTQKVHHQHTLSRAHHHYRDHNPNSKHHTQNQNQNQNQNGYETDSQSASPALISPTLTYSSHTPSTLSPATPFFGSFQGAQEGFIGQGAGERPGVVSVSASAQRAGSH